MKFIEGLFNAVSLLQSFSHLIEGERKIRDLVAPLGFEVDLEVSFRDAPTASANCLMGQVIVPE